MLYQLLAVVIHMEVRGRAVMYTHGKPFLTIMLSKIQVLIWGSLFPSKLTQHLLWIQE